MISYSKIFNRAIMKAIMKITEIPLVDKKLTYLNEDKNKSIQIPDTDGIGTDGIGKVKFDEIIIYNNKKGLDK